MCLPIDLIKLENCPGDGVTKGFRVKIDGPTITQLILD